MVAFQANHAAPAAARVASASKHSHRVAATPPSPAGLPGGAAALVAPANASKPASTQRNQECEIGAAIECLLPSWGGADPEMRWRLSSQRECLSTATSQSEASGGA